VIKAFGNSIFCLTDEEKDPPPECRKEGRIQSMFTVKKIRIQNMLVIIT